MDKNRETSTDSGTSAFSRRIGGLEFRKLVAKRRGRGGVWFGLGMFGLIGWAVAIPAFLGALLGGLIDRHFSGVHSWTLTLLIFGLFLGCLNAWHWVAKQEKTIREEEGGNNE